jgi:hypothetical protein
MRYWLVALAACASSDGAPTPSGPGSAPIAVAVDAGVADAGPPSCIAGTPYDQKTFEDRVAFLASKELDGRVPGTDGDQQARAFVAEKFRCLGLAPAGPERSREKLAAVKAIDFELPFEAAGKDTANVVGVVKGSDPDLADEIIFVGAHHDHEGKGHLGANDNASGVVALLAVAQAIQQRTTKPKRTIVFATFGGEELGMLGSYHLAANPPEGLPIAKIVQFINLDMVGSHAAKQYVAALGVHSKLAARKPLEKLAKKFPKLNVAIGGTARGSDFLPYCKLGVPYAFFWTPDPRCYHKLCDTADKLDYPRMVDIAALAGALTETLADSDDDLLAVRTQRKCGQ